MEESNNTIFTHAKLEYTAQLVDVIAPNLFDGIKSIYDEAKTVHRTNNPNNNSILIIFRLFLEKVPTWSNEVIETETNRIIESSNCDWLNDLITAVFISHTKILTAIGSNNNSNIELIIPKTINFIHKSYINIAREIWKNPYLFDDYVSGSEYQRNMRTVELLIKESIENTIRKALPVKEILKQQLDIYENNNEKSRVTQDDIRKMLLEEIKSLKGYDTESKKHDIDEESEESKENEGLRERINDIEEKYKMEPIEDRTQKEEVQIDEDDDIQQVLEIPETSEDIQEYKNNYYESPDGYVSPDEDEIKNKCENLDINTIPDVGVKEETYDNVDIYSVDRDTYVGDKSLLESYLDDAEKSEIIYDEMFDKDEVKNVEMSEGSNDHEIKKEPIKKETEPLFTITKKKEDPEPYLKPEPEPEPDPDPEPEPEPEPEPVSENKEEEKEIISVDRNDDTETVDLFFEDVSKMLEKKGIDIDKGKDKYTLFDDAIMEEDDF